MVDEDSMAINLGDLKEENVETVARTAGGHPGASRRKGAVQIRPIKIARSGEGYTAKYAERTYPCEHPGGMQEQGNIIFYKQ
jgi:hypothetical protein